MPSDARPATAVLLGATGLVGGQLLRQLLADERFGAVAALSRRTAGLAHPRLTEHLVDFRQPQAWAELARGDVLFSCLGTTRAAAGSVEAQREVDYTFQHAAAVAAAENGVACYALVSSGGASARSPVPYARMKGELEAVVQGLGFPRVRILRPGVLVGERQAPRAGEALGASVLGLAARLPGLGALRPIEGAAVARALIAAWADAAPGCRIYGPGEVHRLAAAAG